MPVPILLKSSPTLLCAALLAAASCPVYAANAPATIVTAPAGNPAAAGSIAAAPSAETPAGTKRAVDEGSTIVGDQDAAVGLYLTPWKNESSAEMDRAPGLLDQETTSLGAKTFSEKIESNDALVAYRRSRMQSNR